MKWKNNVRLVRDSLSIEGVSRKQASEVSETNQARVLIKTTGLERGVRSVRALLHNIALTFLHRCKLVLFGWVSIPHDHVDLGVAQHRGERYEVDASHCHACGPRVPEVVQPERGNLTSLDCGCVCCVDFNDRGIGTTTGKQVVTFDVLKPFLQDVRSAHA